MKKSRQSEATTKIKKGAKLLFKIGNEIVESEEKRIGIVCQDCFTCPPSIHHQNGMDGRDDRPNRDDLDKCDPAADPRLSIKKETCIWPGQRQVQLSGHFYTGHHRSVYTFTLISFFCLPSHIEKNTVFLLLFVILFSFLVVQFSIRSAVCVFSHVHTHHFIHHSPE